MTCQHLHEKYILKINTVRHQLAMGTCSKKCVSRQFYGYENITEYTYANLNGIAYFTPRLYGMLPSYMHSFID